jgi:hypothetical protein
LISSIDAPPIFELQELAYPMGIGHEPTIIPVSITPQSGARHQGVSLTCESKSARGIYAMNRQKASATPLRLQIVKLLEYATIGKLDENLNFLKGPSKPPYVKQSGRQACVAAARLACQAARQKGANYDPDNGSLSQL